MGDEPRFARRARTAFRVARLFPWDVTFALAGRVLTLPRLARLAWRPARGVHDPAAEARVVAAAEALRRFGFGDRSCLARSLTIYRELSKGGANPEVVLGFRKGPHGLEGHAWVVVGERIVADAADYTATFVPQFRLGAGGEVVTSVSR